MASYVKLKDGRRMVVCSDNIDEKTMHGYNINEEAFFDVEWDTCDKWDYADIIQHTSNKMMLD